MYMEKNVFQEIESDEVLPPQVKKETLGTLFSMKMIADFIDLFVVKAGATFSNSLGGSDKVELNQK